MRDAGSSPSRATAPDGLRPADPASPAPGELSRPSVWLVGGEDVRLRIPLLVELRRRGFRVGAIGSEDGAAFAQAELPYRRYPLRRWLHPLADLRALRRLADIFAAVRPDVVHGFDTKPAILAPLAAARAGVPVRMRTITGLGFLFSSQSLLPRVLRPVYGGLQRRASAASQLTVFQNDDDRRELIARGLVPGAKAVVVAGSGVDVARLEEAVPDGRRREELATEIGVSGRKVVIMVSRLVVHKGVREFLAAASLVRASRDDVRFVLVGPLASEGRQAISPAEIRAHEDGVTWLGSRTDVPALLSISDVFAFPSYYREGVPRALLEAAALGLPIVTTDMPGCRDVVEQGGSGLLVPTRDVRALAGAISVLLDRASWARTLGARAALRVRQRFTLSGIADRYAALYQRLWCDAQRARAA